MREALLNNLNTKIPEFEQGWNEIVSTLGNDFLKLFRHALTDDNGILSSLKDLSINIVIDNNFIFGQIKSIVNNKTSLKDCFISRLLEFPYIKLYAPYYIETELFEVINRVIPEKEYKARKLAKHFLKEIELSDAFWVEDWLQAKRKIGPQDPKDVPYLALAFDLKGHGILTNDKHFKDLTDIKTFSISDTERIATNFKQGIISFAIVGGTIEVIRIFCQIMAAFFALILDVAIELVDLIVELFKGVGVALSKIPNYVWFTLIGVLVIGLIISPDARKKTKEMLKWIVEHGEKVIQELIDFIRKLINNLKVFYKTIEPYAINTAQFYLFMIENYSELEEQLVRLEEERIRGED